MNCGLISIEILFNFAEKSRRSVSIVFKYVILLMYIVRDAKYKYISPATVSPAYGNVSLIIAYERKRERSTVAVRGSEDNLISRACR